MPLSPQDQQLIERLYAEGVLREAKLETSLQNVLVITDPACQRPDISFDVQTQPVQFMVFHRGGCALHEISSEEQHEFIRAQITRQMRSVFELKRIEQIALVASIPSPDPKRTLVDTIDEMRSAEEFTRRTFGKNYQVHGFVSVSFPDGRNYTFQITPKFHTWYDRYEREVLGRDGRSLEDDSEPNDAGQNCIPIC